MKVAIVAALLASGQFITPTSAGDFEAFAKLAIASQKCAGVLVDYEGAISQVADLGIGMGLDAKGVGDHVRNIEELAEKQFKDDPGLYCRRAHDLLNEYDPAHLKEVGVIR